MNRTNRLVLMIGGGLFGLIGTACVLGLVVWLLIIPPPTTPPGSTQEPPKQTPEIREKTATAGPTSQPVVFDPEWVTQHLSSSIVLIRVELPRGQASGTGIVFRGADGKIYILTNAHVAEGQVTISITPNGSKEERPARVVGLSSCDDLAVLAVADTNGLRPATFGMNVRLTEPVVALGFPLSFEIGDGLTVTTGTISNVDRPVKHFKHVIQTNAAITHGSSGGALANAAGEVIGITTLGFGDNINFAISATYAQTIIKQILDDGNVMWIGAELGEIKVTEDKQVFGVLAIDSGSPAARAGLQLGDILLRVENKDVASKTDVCRILDSHTKGDSIKMTFLRFTETETQVLEGDLSIGDPSRVQEFKVVERQPHNQTSTTDTQVPEQAAQPTATPSSGSTIFVLGAAHADAVHALHNTQQGASQEVLFETFGSDTTKYYWYQSNDEGLATQYDGTGGVYLLTLKQPKSLDGEFLREYGQNQYKTIGGAYIVELDVSFGDGGLHSVGIAFDDQGGGSGSAFVIRNDGTWRVITFVNGQVAAEFTSEAITTNTIINKPNQLRVMRQADGSTIFWINDTPVASMPRGPFGGGAMGVATLSDADLSRPVTVVADNFRLLQLQ